jgi:hypothetical protein
MIHEVFSKVSPGALKFSLESHSGAFSVVTLRVATLKLPGMIFSKIFSKSVRRDF